MSERKVLNKYYPPDFDPSKIPRARCPRNRQFTVRLMVPCNIKCYTCGEYIAKGKKFNARKEDVENMTYLGVRIYRFYIKCPGCLAEISFRTDPESTDYVIEAGAHRNFQALKLAEEQAAREEREAKEEIESNPMLLLENRTQQSQYEMEVLESLEDLREMNDRHAGIDLGKIAQRFETERKMTQEQIEEMERQAALKALGYEMVEGELIKRINPEELDEDKPLVKKLKTDRVASEAKECKDFTAKVKNCNLKSRLAGMIKTKSSKENDKKTEVTVETQEARQKNTIPKETEAKLSHNPQKQTPGEAKHACVTGNIDNTESKVELASESKLTSLSDKCLASITTRANTTAASTQPVRTSGPSALSILGTYSDSDSNESD